MTGNQDPSRYPFLHLALPVMDEPDTLPRLLACLASQHYRRFRLYACVNQPEAWRDDPFRLEACRNNAASLDLLNNWKDCETVVIDRASRGNGWTGKRLGVGFARKTVMDRINAVAGPDDVIVSLDADTEFSPGFLESVARNFSRNRDAVALAIPYLHKLTGDERPDRAILRYEIYMRHYLLNMIRIGSPYAFTALGSAMALPVSAFRAIGGMTPKLSGEDFYFLQKLRKFGRVMSWNEEPVFPAARFSDRVFFGTGPAMIRGDAGDWSSYPVYPVKLFDDVMETCLLLPLFYFRTIDTPVSRFLSEIFHERDPFAPLRANHRDPDHFTRAFHEKFDGLRILQYLKSNHRPLPGSDEQNLTEFLEKYHPARVPACLKTGVPFTGMPVGELEKVRDVLYLLETEARISGEPQ